MTPRLTPALETAIRALLRDLAEPICCPVCGFAICGACRTHTDDCTIPPVVDALREAVSPPPSGYLDLGPMVKS